MTADCGKENLLKHAVLTVGITDYGVCDYNSVLPLIPCRNVTRIPAGAKSVICFLFPYFVKEQTDRNLSYYACVPDYHKTVLDRLNRICAFMRENDGEYIPFCDNSPIREVYAAALCGLGVIGKNNLLLTEKYGSYVFIGSIVTTDYYMPSRKEVSYCNNCGNCIKHCPTGFLQDSDNLCLSAVTQKKGELNEEQKNLIKTHKLAWGCDICQQVCPYNRDVMPTYIDEFISGFKPIITETDIRANITTAAYGWRGESVIRRNLNMLN